MVLAASGTAPAVERGPEGAAVGRLPFQREVDAVVEPPRAEPQPVVSVVAGGPRPVHGGRIEHADLAGTGVGGRQQVALEPRHVLQRGLPRAGGIIEDRPSGAQPAAPGGGGGGGAEIMVGGGGGSLWRRGTG